jgi:hypothetical protein
MKLFILFMLALATFANGATTERLEGHLFSHNGVDYITEHYGTTSPQYALKWKRKDEKKDLCFASAEIDCPKYLVSFIREKSEKKGPVFTQAQIVSIFDDPVALQESYKVK